MWTNVESYYFRHLSTSGSMKMHCERRFVSFIMRTRFNFNLNITSYWIHIIFAVERIYIGKREHENAFK